LIQSFLGTWHHYLVSKKTHYLLYLLYGTDGVAEPLAVWELPLASDAALKPVLGLKSEGEFLPPCWSWDFRSILEGLI
jgi:hypothetical protein